MTHRVVVRCKNCSEHLTLRIVVAGGVQPFVFACPHCSVPLHGTFLARVEPMELRTESEDFDALQEEEADPVFVAVSTDVPVHLALVGARGDGGLISPFIFAVNELGHARATKLMERVEALRSLRAELFASVRMAASFWAERDAAGLTRALEASPLSGSLDLANETPMALFDELVGLLFAPIEVDDAREPCAEELLRLLGKALDDDPEGLAALLAEFDAGPLEEHRRRVIAAVFGALDDVDAFLPALWAEAMDGRVDLTQYRVMRDDFARRKISYQDLFELASRTLAFTARVANLVLRGDARTFVDGKSRNLTKALKARAVEREQWLADFPVASPRFQAVSRRTRNDIGHVLVRQDVRRGLLVYEDGTEQNYMHFLVDWLQAVRLARYMLDVLMILDYTRTAVRAHRGPKS